MNIYWVIKLPKERFVYCKLCKKKIRRYKYEKHLEKVHGKVGRLQILVNEVVSTKGDPFKLFELSKKLFHNYEGKDVSQARLLFDDQISGIERVSPSYIPPSEAKQIMGNLTLQPENDHMAELILEKAEGTKIEEAIKAHIINGSPLIVIYRKNMVEQISEWKKEGKTKDPTYNIIFSFLHELYHTIGANEKEADENASKIMERYFRMPYRFDDFRRRIWKADEERRKNR